MLPRLDTLPEPDELHREFARLLQQGGFAGDIQLDFSSRTLQSTDNSIYQRFPLGVLYPANTQDLIRIAELMQSAQFHSLAFCPRGGGTGTNGQALGESFVVDLSRHMNRILEINVKERWARVQAGVVKDQLNAEIEQHSLFFAPDLSTSNRATIGGMISTDASGQGSCRYGKTRDHVLATETVLADGSCWTSQPVEQEALNALRERPDLVGEVHRVADDIHRQHQSEISAIFPPLNRSLTGYDLAHLRTANQYFDLNSLLCGSEGTLGFIAQATLNLEPLPRCTALVVIQYSDFVAALRDGRQLMSAQPTAIETIDNNIVDLAKGDAIWPRVSEFFPVDSSRADEMAAVNFVEFSGDSEAELAKAMEPLIHSLQHGPSNPQRLGYVRTSDSTAISEIWNMRKKSVGLLGNMPGRKRPVPFVEDTAVPPEQLADYIAEFRAILDRRQLRYGMFGHADAGVIHVRPALDMRDPESMAMVRDISDKVFALTQRYGGVLWGEHGKGVRSEYSPQTFGTLYPQLQRIKASFDPRNQFNPGKIATPSSTRELLRIDGPPTRGQRDRLIPTHIWEDFGDATNCNGNAACFNWDPDQTMCPSWKSTRERKYSPKGRASLMKEWLSQLAEHGYQADRKAANGASPGKLFSKLGASLGKWAGQKDFSHQVHDSMDSCLACKGCTSGCPVQVDVPAFRSVFFNYYYRRYLRPLRHHGIARLETLLPWAAKTPALYNSVTQLRPMQWLVEKIAGIAAIPAISSTKFERELEALKIEIASPERLQSLADEEKQRSVVLVQDVFTRYFEADLVLDVCRFFQAINMKVWLAPYAPNGKPLHVLGFLPAFTKTARDTAHTLQQLAASGIPLVGIEPSMTLTYRSEYLQSLPRESVPPVLLLQEWLATQSEVLRKSRERFTPGEYRLLPHCSEAALANTTLSDWQQVFSDLGSTLAIEQTGCCGMAGTYGHEVKHAGTSKTIYELSWANKIENGSEGDCATGFSCRCQVERFSSKRIPHPVQLLLGQTKA